MEITKESIERVTLDPPYVVGYCGGRLQKLHAHIGACYLHPIRREHRW